MHRFSLVAAAVVALAAIVAPRSSRASTPARHLVRIDVLELVAGRIPKAHHFDLFVATDGARTQTHVGDYTVAARWSERQGGRPTMTLSIDRGGALPMHSSARFRPMLAALPWMFGSGSKGMLTEVMVTVL